jgi:hypothetical protein
MPTRKHWHVLTSIAIAMPTRKHWHVLTSIASYAHPQTRFDINNCSAQNWCRDAGASSQSIGIYQMIPTGRGVYILKLSIVLLPFLNILFSWHCGGVHDVGLKVRPTIVFSARAAPDCPFCSTGKDWVNEYKGRQSGVNLIKGFWTQLSVEH